ncbi:hypothetical protein [Spirosoma endbachense]|uniref:Uncharacterized protein n=1 Tax=Spirosoma endbachense TaxID=2666025 RepID=A0A6P1VYM8_9BACT|nr:hypothetical protein [Spirosoma endbachense]QHV98253.1 hypothetical protein GJR95_26060 [Spirosoma endbachense]
MKNWTALPIQLAQTRQGKVVLHNNGELWYAFQFGTLYRYLTADEFLRLHDSVMAYDPMKLPVKSSQLDGHSTHSEALNVTLFGLLTRADLIELKALLGWSALKVTSLSRIWNDVN